jgi:hypothetical protein
MGGRAWTEEEQKYILEHYATHSNREMADYLGRTEASVQLQVNRSRRGEGRKPRMATKMGKYAAGDTVGSLKIEEVFEKMTEEGRRTYCKCVCDCGKTLERSMHDLSDRENHSCGCRKSRAATTHGKSKTKIYGHWCCMRARCLDPNYRDYHRYGGRGITICPEWEDPLAFYVWACNNGYKKGLTLDRIRNNQGYSLSNCKWSTPQEQANNRDNNRLMTVFEETKTVSEWSRDPRCMVCEMTIRYRIANGWPDHDAVTTPPGERKWRGGSRKRSKSSPL